MPDITTFVLNNIWLCVGIGALVVIIADEVLGVSRALLSDPTDNLPYDKNVREREQSRTPAPAPDELDQLDQFGNAEDGPSVEDMLRPK